MLLFCYSVTLMKNEKEIRLFSSPLILGASISAGYGTRDGGIGAVLAKKVNPEANIINKAKSGATSVVSTSHLDFNSYNPSIVLALDLFFWDAVRGETGKVFEKNTQRLFDSFRTRKIPMIVGKIPVLDLPVGGFLKDVKKNASKVNMMLEDLKGHDHHILLYDPLPCFMGLNSDIHFSDGLHLTSEGNRYCAEFFLQSGEHRRLALLS